MSDILAPTVEGDFTFGANEPFALDAGGSLHPGTLHYALYGELNVRRDNAILVCHALSGSARVADWWSELVGPDKPFDTSRYCIVGINILGSCYGSSGPLSINPRTEQLYGGSFPLVSIDDMVRSQALLLDHLGIDRLHAVVGASIGGMQALSWAVYYPRRVPRCLAIGVTPLNSLALALNHLQRQAIRNDPNYRDGNYSLDEPPSQGLALARGIAMCTYKSPELFEQRFGRRPDRSGEQPACSLTGRYDIGGYLDHQGKLFLRRFDANSYLLITKAMDNFQLGGDAAEEAAALGRIQARVLLVGITSDWLFPPGEVRGLAERMQAVGVKTSYRELVSMHGHDGFLADGDLLVPILVAALEEPAYSTTIEPAGLEIPA